MSRRPLDVAIVGMACRFPGASDLGAFWENVLAARVAIGPVPPGRWDAAEFHDPDSDASDRVGGRVGGYLDDPVALNLAACGVMPRTVEGGEPEQFLVLDTARAALADAGLAGGVPDGRRVEVVIGRGNYFNRGNLTRLQHGRVLAQTLAILRTLHPDWTAADIEAVRADLKATLPPFEAATIPGQLTNATAGRVAFRLDLRGPCYVVDAASASSLLAVDLGARALATRRADLALVGGVYVEADVDFPLVFSRLRVLSRSGRSRPFAAEADGLVPGEGVGVVVLKRLGDAERDGDRIYAVIKGVGIAADGRGRGLASPDARGHLRAIRRAYRGSGVDPATVGLVEGHGLGVPASDRAELKALRAAFPTPASGGRRVLGAVSALIGHAMPAAGMAGLIKAALALHHRALPASPAGDAPHPLLVHPDSPLALNPVTRPWIQGHATPRRASVNAFGFAGINAHAVLEEHAGSADGVTPGALMRWPDEAVLLAAPDRAGLVDRVRWLAARLDERADVALKDLAFTLGAEAVMSGQPARLGLVVKSVSDLRARLDTLTQKLADPACRAIRDGRGVYFWERPLGREGGLAFLFPGEGSQYPGMLADLCLHFPEVRALFDTSDRLAVESGAIEPPNLRLFGANADMSLWAPGTAVNVVLSSQWALYTLLRRVGLRPDALAGHSSGEFLALAAAGAVRVDRRLEERFNALAALFARIEAEGAVPAARLVAVAADRARVEAFIGEHVGAVAVVVDNCPHQVVIAGPEEAVEAVIARHRAAGVACEDLPFARAYHTPAFARALGPVRAFFDDLEIAAPTAALYSCCVASRVAPDPDEVRRLAVAQWTRPVEFRATVEAMHANGLRLFVDVGARGNLAGFVEDTLRGRPAFAVAANLPRRSGLTQFNHLVAALFAQGIALDPSFLHARRRPERIDLEQPAPPRRATFPLRLGFPEMSLSEDLAVRLRTTQGRSTTGNGRMVVHHPGSNGDGHHETDRKPEATLAAPPPWSNRITDHLPPDHEAGEQDESDAAMLAYLDTMRSFLATQRSVMDALGINGHETTLAHMPHPPARAPVEVCEAVGMGVSTASTASLANHQPNGTTPGPWAGQVRSFIPGKEVVVTLTLDADGDPVAEHHTFGGRRISAVNPGLKGLPVLPFTVMAEMLAEAAARLLPGLTLVGLKEVRARRWVRYEDEPITLEVRAEALADRPGHVRAALYNRGPSVEERPAVEGVVVFDAERHPAHEAAAFDLPDAGPSRFNAESMYAEQWLFHGPALQAVVGVGPVAPGGIEGTLRVLPRRALARDPGALRPLTDLIVLDAFTHLLGLWGLDCLPEGDVVFPLRLGSLEVFGTDPPEGTDVACRIAVRKVDRHRVTVDAEFVRPDGRAWMRLRDWEDWRFYWPSRYRDVFRQPDRVLLGEPLPLPDADGAAAVWLRPPADMGRPVWRDVLEQIQLAPEERAEHLRAGGPDERRTLRLWGRIAAKEAARRLWLGDGADPVYPADLRIEPDDRGRPILRSRAEPARDDLPSISIAHAGGVAVALAARDPSARVGIDVERVVPRSHEFEALAFSARERGLLDQFDPSERAAWAARLWCAKESAAKATGLGLVAGPGSVEVHEIDSKTGTTTVSLGRELAAACPDLSGAPLAVATALRDEYAWAWTIAKGRLP
jgi:acyl transferase domain-containing protein/phosphopantetheinyl transferase